MAILASALHLDSSDLALPLSQGTAGSCDPLSANTCPFPLSLPWFYQVSRWEGGSPASLDLDLVVTIPSLFVAFRYQKPYRNRFVWNCLDRPNTIGILNGKYVTKNYRYFPKNLIL